MAEEAEEMESEGFGEGAMTQEDLDALLAEAEQREEAQEQPGASLGMVDLPSFDLPESSAVSSSYESAGLNRVRDIPLEVTVELGRTRLLIRDILDLSAGSIIELDKLAGEPVDLFANGMLVARGEVIVIDDNFGVRVTEIITAADRSAPQKDAHALAA